jgi:hypothetical protein
MPPVGFEPTISVLERAKTVRALDRATTAVGWIHTSVTFEINMNNVRLHVSNKTTTKTPWPESASEL